MASLLQGPVGVGAAANQTAASGPVATAALRPAVSTHSTNPALWPIQNASALTDATWNNTSSNGSSTANLAPLGPGVANPGKVAVQSVLTVVGLTKASLLDNGRKGVHDLEAA